MILDSIFHINIRNKKLKINSKEKIRRSLIKTILWRFIGTIDTIAISWLITGRLNLALSIGSIELVSKMILYFLHERTWDKIEWGR